MNFATTEKIDFLSRRVEDGVGGTLFPDEQTFTLATTMTAPVGSLVGRTGIGTNGHSNSVLELNAQAVESVIKGNIMVANCTCVQWTVFFKKRVKVQESLRASSVPEAYFAETSIAQKPSTPSLGPSLCKLSDWLYYQKSS